MCVRTCRAERVVCRRRWPPSNASGHLHNNAPVCRRGVRFSRERQRQRRGPHTHAPCPSRARHGALDVLLCNTRAPVGWTKRLLRCWWLEGYYSVGFRTFYIFFTIYNTHTHTYILYISNTKHDLIVNEFKLFIVFILYFFSLNYISAFLDNFLKILREFFNIFH